MKYYRDDPPPPPEVDDPPTPPTPTPTPADNKFKFTPEQQAFVNNLLAEEKRKLQKKNETIIADLQKLRENINISQSQREQLEQRIEILKNEYLTKEELQKQERSKAIKDRDKKIQDLTEETNNWKNKYTTTIIDNAIISAAVKHEAYNPSQIVDILRPKTRMTEIFDEEGKPKPFEYEPKVKLTKKDKEGKSVVLDLTVTEAVEQMKNMEDFFNLFNSGVKGGIGANNARRMDSERDGPPTDPTEYMAWRKKNPQSVGRRQ